MRRVLVKVLRRNVAVLATHHAAQAREERLDLIGAAFDRAVGLAVIDAAGHRSIVDEAVEVFSVYYAIEVTSWSMLLNDDFYNRL